jgi:prevent-host-death family protein
MSKVNIHQAKTQFSRLVDLAADGQEIIIAKAGKPVARLVAYIPKGAARRPGRLRGRIRVKKDFDRPLPKSILASFQGES